MQSCPTATAIPSAWCLTSKSVLQANASVTSQRALCWNVWQLYLYSIA